MGLKANIGALSEDSVQAGVLQGQLQTASAAVTAIQQQITDLGGKTGADDAAVSADLQALPPGTIALYTNADGSFSGYEYSPAAPGFTVKPVVTAS